MWVLKARAIDLSLDTKTQDSVSVLLIVYGNELEAVQEHMDGGSNQVEVSGF